MVLANSDLGRFLKSIGLGNELKNISDVVGLIKERLSGFAALDSFEIRLSKPYIERSLRTLQHSFMSSLSGFIVHNIAQRQAIEFFNSKKERR